MRDRDERIMAEIDADTARQDRIEQNARWSDTPIPRRTMTDAEREHLRTHGWVR